MSIVLVGSTSGSVTLQEPAVAGTTVIDLPATSGTMVVTGGAQTVQFAAGSASTPSITFTGDTNTGIFSPAADTIAFTEGGTEAMRLTSTGNVGIGTTSPSATLDVGSSVARSGSAQNNIYADYRITAATTGVVSSLASRIVGIGGSTYTIPDVAVYKADPTVAQSGVTITNAYGLYIGDMRDPTTGGSVTNGWGVYQTTSNNRNYFAGQLNVGSTVSSASKMLITNTNNVSGDQNTSLQLGANCNNTSSYYLICSTVGSGADRMYILGNGNLQNTNNSYGALSDIKLKENIVDATPKLEKLKQVRVVTYNLKENPDQKLLGVVAQELEQIFPSMIEETPDRDVDGNVLDTTTKSVKYSVFVPMLIKAMQEQQAIITDLKARIETLENK